MLKKVLLGVMLVTTVFACYTSVMACGGDEPSGNPGGSYAGQGGGGCSDPVCDDDNLLDAMMCQGSHFGNSGSTEGIGDTLEDFVLGDVFDAVFAIGNLIFAAITVILGAKYIWSSAEGKSQVQESLPTFVLAVIFFYLAEPLLGLILDVTSNVTTSSNWQELSGNFIWIINTVVKYVALGGLIFMGVRYLLASAEGRASLKTSMGGMVIGVLFVFLASNVVNFIIEMGSDVM